MSEALRVAWAVDALPRALEQGGLPLAVEQACLEAFFLYVRLLVEFLQVKRGDRRDFHAGAIVAGWKPKLEPPQQKALMTLWQTASEQVSHFSTKRVRSEEAPAVIVDVSPAALAAIADSVLAVWDQFTAAASPTAFAIPRSDFATFLPPSDSGTPTVA